MCDCARPLGESSSMVERESGAEETPRVLSYKLCKWVDLVLLMNSIKKKFFLIIQFI